MSHRIRKTSQRLIPLLPVIGVGFVLLLFTAIEAYARAGGGGGYSGGGGGGFSGGGGYSGGGGSGGGDGIGLLILLIIEYPAIGIPLAIGVAIFMVIGANKGKQGYTGHIIRRGAAVLTHQQQKDMVASMVAVDPNFNFDLFKRRIEDAFIRVQAAWSNQALEPIRPFVSDGIYERFSLQIQEQIDLKYRNVMEEVSVHGIYPAEFHSDDVFDTLTLRIKASAVDYRVELGSTREIHGHRRDESFTEFWSFVRRTGVHTEPGKTGLLEGNCPNCGAAIQMNQTAKCTACESLLRSGEYDWVLAEITQDCEWRPRKQNLSLQTYQSNNDPSFNVQHLEDRASVMFWRRAMADRLGRPEPLEKMASDTYMEHYKSIQATSADPKAGREYMGYAAVGSVEAHGILPGDEMDRAVVEIRWSGRTFTEFPDGKRKESEQSRVLQSIFILGRKSGVTTDAEQSISSAHCPGCGSPVTDSASHACDYCGIVLNDGTKDWILLDVQPKWAPEMNQLLNELKMLDADTEMPPVADVASASGRVVAPPTPERVTTLTWMIKMALSDHVLDDREHELLQQVARRTGIDDDRLEVMIDAARQGHADIPEPEDEAEARQWIESITDTALADGKISSEEKEIILQVGNHLGYVDWDIKNLIKERRAALYRQAKGQIQAQRRNAQMN